jgi:hypothetical protein
MSNKKSNVTAAEASSADPALQTNLMSEIKQAQEARQGQGKGRASCHNMFQLYKILL